MLTRPRQRLRRRGGLPRARKPLPFLPDRSASERALRCGVAVDGGCAAVGWWSRIGGGAAVWSRPVGCGKGRRTAQVGLPRLSPSLCLGRWAGRAFCLGRWMGVCLRLHPGRWPQGEGRSAVWCGGRWRVLPLGRMKRVILQVWAGRVLPMWIRATRQQALGCQAAGGMASGLVAGGRSDEGRMGRRQSITGRPLCWRQDEAAAVCQVAIRDRASCWRLRAINLRLGGRMEGAVCSPRFGCEAGRRPEGGRRRSSGQTGSGLGRRLSGRRSRSGGLRGAAQAQAVRRAGRQSGRRRQRGSGVQPRARKPGDGGGTAAWSAATPFRFSAQHDGG